MAAPVTGATRWFSHQITRDEAPWLFDKDPHRHIATLVLMAIIFGVVLWLGPRSSEAAAMGKVSFTAGTDNKGNTGVVKKFMTTRWPLCCVAMKLGAQLGKRVLDLYLQWLPRDLYEEADALTNLDFTKFDPAMRVEASVTLKALDTMNALLNQGTAIEEAKRAARRTTSSSSRGTTRMLSDLECPTASRSAARKASRSAARTRSAGEAWSGHAGTRRKRAAAARR